MRRAAVSSLRRPSAPAVRREQSPRGFNSPMPSPRGRRLCSSSLSPSCSSSAVKMFGADESVVCCAAHPNLKSYAPQNPVLSVTVRDNCRRPRRSARPVIEIPDGIHRHYAGLIGRAHGRHDRAGMTGQFRAVFPRDQRVNGKFLRHAMNHQSEAVRQQRAQQGFQFFFAELPGTVRFGDEIVSCFA